MTESITTYGQTLSDGWIAGGAARRGVRKVHRTSPQTNASVLRTWDVPCEAMFEYLANQQPDELFRLVESDALSPGLLTHAAEWCGRTKLEVRARRVLLPLLSHSAALVREGAILGLQLLPSDSVVREAIERRTSPMYETSAGVRAAARDALLLLDE
jgi:hypothetical protein